MLFRSGGTSVVEVIFSYPGLGNLAVSAITSSDYNLIQGYVLWLALIYMVINLIVDASYVYIDPRMRLKDGRFQELTRGISLIYMALVLVGKAISGVKYTL